ncbi:hypothetical protein J6590_056791 [Homalodisca vitripennis]|nr:hypothetical protein J6590_056791 [Homalodisca vitripennis]
MSMADYCTARPQTATPWVVVIVGPPGHVDDRLLYSQTSNRNILGHVDDRLLYSQTSNRNILGSVDSVTSRRCRWQTTVQPDLKPQHPGYMGLPALPALTGAELASPSSKVTWLPYSAHYHPSWISTGGGPYPEPCHPEYPVTLEGAQGSFKDYMHKEVSRRLVRKYKLDRQPLNFRNKLVRVQYCASMLAIWYEEPEFLSDVWFTDECHVHLNGFINKQTTRFLGFERPDIVVERPQHIHSPDLTTPDAYVWGMLKENIFHEDPPSTIVQLKEKTHFPWGINDNPTGYRGDPISPQMASSNHPTIDSTMTCVLYSLLHTSTPTQEA